MNARASAKEEVRRQAGERLRQARIAAGYGEQIDFYEAFAIPQGTYANHEGGLRGMDLPTAQAYADKLENVSAGWILTGEGDPPKKLPPKLSRGKRALIGDAETSGDPKESSVDEKMAFIWRHLRLEIKLAVVSLVETLVKVWPDRPPK
jgi:hypothetical protein